MCRQSHGAGCNVGCTCACLEVLYKCLGMADVCWYCCHGTLVVGVSERAAVVICLYSVPWQACCPKAPGRHRPCSLPTLDAVHDAAAQLVVVSQFSH